MLKKRSILEQLLRRGPEAWFQRPRRPQGREALGTTPGPEDQGPPVLGPVGGAHRPPWPQDGSSGQGWDRRWGPSRAEAQKGRRSPELLPIYGKTRICLTSYFLLSHYCSSLPYHFKAKKSGSYAIRFSTRAYDGFTLLHPCWNSSGRKLLPPTIYEDLTPVALALWAQCDGTKQAPAFVLCTPPVPLAPGPPTYGPRTVGPPYGPKDRGPLVLRAGGGTSGRAAVGRPPSPLAPGRVLGPGQSPLPDRLLRSLQQRGWAEGDPGGPGPEGAFHKTH